MEVDGIGKPLLIPESPALDLDGFDAAVDALGWAVGDAMNNGIDNAPKMALDHASHLLDGFQATPNGPGIPLLPCFEGPAAAYVVPDRHRQLLDGPCAGGFVRTLSQPFKGLPFALRHVFGVLQPVEFRSREVLDALAHQLFVFLSPHLVNALSEVLCDMKFVKADLLISPRHNLKRSMDIRWPHVHTDGLDSRKLLFIKPLEPRLEGFLRSAFGNMKDGAGYAVGSHRNVVVPLLEGRLVHANMLRRRALAPYEAAFDGPVHDIADRRPAQIHLSGDSRDCGVQQPIDDVDLEKDRKSCIGLRPGHLQHHDPVFRTRHSRHVRLDDRAQVARVKVAPSALPAVITGPRRAALWAFMGVSTHVVHRNNDLLGSCAKVNRGHTPRLCDAQPARNPRRGRKSLCLSCRLT